MPLILVLCLFFCQPAWATPTEFVVEPALSKIDCSVKYALIGHYTPHFEDFSGIISFDPNDLPHSKVDIKIKTASIKSSRYPRLDRMARSSLLLDAQKYPDMSFQSKSLKKTREGYRVAGTMSIHGITKQFSFPFTIKPVKNSLNKLAAEGQWIINRKDFNVIWNKVLDRGGIVVSDQIIVDWEIVGRKR